MASTARYQCKWCGDQFTARTADRKRGWARFCSKTCKAKEQEKRTHQNANHNEWQKSRDHDDCMAWIEAGWDGHKNTI